MRHSIVIALLALAACWGCGSGNHVVGDADATDVADSDAADTAVDTSGDTPADTEPEDVAGEDVGPEEDAVEDVVEEEVIDPLMTDDDSDGFSEWEGDCDDTDPGIYPGATTHIEGVDYDCDGRREWLARMYVAVDDAFDLCINGLPFVSTCTSTTCGCFCWSGYHEQVVDSGLNVFGVHGYDIVGISASFAMWLEVAGVEIPTRGRRPTEPDTEDWRYFPSAGEEPQATWCDQTFDDSTWGPAVFASEIGDTLGFHHPPEQIKLGTTWLWDGNPPGLGESWFRLEVMVPSDPPVWDPPGSPTCTVGTPRLVSLPTTITEKRTDNGCDVVWNGTGWVAVYDEWVRPWSWSSPSGGCDDVQTRLLSADGTPAAPGVNINDQGSSTDTNALWWNMWPSAVWTGSSILAFYEDARWDRTRDYLFGHMLTATGGLIGNDVRLENNGTAVTQKFPTAAWTGSEVGVAWQDDRNAGFEIYFKRFTPSLAAVGSSVRLTNAIGTSRVPDMVWNGSEYGIVWEENRDSGDHEIYFTRISSTGSKVGSDVRLTTSPGQSMDPEIAWGGSRYGVSWHDDGWVNMEIGFMTLDAAGTIASGPFRVTSDSHVSVESEILWNGSAFAIVYRDNRTGGGDIYLSVLSPDGTEIVDDEQITDTPGVSMQPSIAWNGSSYGIVWKEEEDPSDPASTEWNLDTWFVNVSCP